jgi:hypothetical protein
MTIIMPASCNLIIGSVGDLSFRGRHENHVTGEIFQHVQATFSQTDFLVANLESPLTSVDASPVPGKCTLRGSTGWAEILRQAGIKLVTLANNHMMDYGDKGLVSTMTALDEVGILYVGAGCNREAACLPVMIKIAGKTVAFLGRSSVEVSSRCYAGQDQPGVAFLHESELVTTIKECRQRADLIVVMLHWGMEHYHYPTPQQRNLAAKLVSAGADILLGHHPHVLQGEEVMDKALISYSSGNFLFDEFSWVDVAEKGEKRVYTSTLTEKNRQGIILQLKISADRGIVTNQTFTVLSDNAAVNVDTSVDRLKEYKKLSSRLEIPQYNRFWKLYSIKREWDLRLSSQLSPSHILRNLYKIRPRHFKEVATKLRRSAKISTGKSTNPYEG